LLLTVPTALLLPLASLASIGANAANWVLALGGIGLVVFVHELGHFLVAKKCKVRVEVFSLGFGPRLFGLKRGDTDYRFSLVPIGGYVKMAGDQPSDAPVHDGSDLPSKSVGQRFAIFSAGVAMNLVFAVVVLPVVFYFGVQFHSTRIGAVSSGGAAWRAGLEKGDEVVAVGGHEVCSFDDVIAEVALSGGEDVDLLLARAGDREHVTVRPELDELQGRYVIGTLPELSPTFDVVPNGPAARAGVGPQDRVVAFDGQRVASVQEFDALRAENRAHSVTLRVVGADGKERDAVVEPADARPAQCLIGVKPYVNVVKAVRRRAAVPGFLEPKDEVVAVEFANQRLVAVGDERDLADALEQAVNDPKARLVVERNGSELRLELPAGADRALAQDVAFAPPTGRRVRLVKGYPAALAGVPEGAEVVKVNHVAVADWESLKHEIEKAAPKGSAADAPDARPGDVELVLRVGTEESRLQSVPEAPTLQTVRVTPRLERLPVDFGLVPSIAMVTRKFPFAEAVKVGVSEAGYLVKTVYVTLVKMLRGKVSPTNLSGILTIANVSHSYAEWGVPTLFFFLALISLNLAFLNVLPIPVLDGGHLFFLLVEKVKGSPVSEKVLSYSQLVGLLLVLALLLYVTVNDLRHILPS
jgi:regulator of sigma E protease